MTVPGHSLYSWETKWTSEHEENNAHIGKNRENNVLPGTITKKSSTAAIMQFLNTVCTRLGWDTGQGFVLGSSPNT